MIFQNCLKFHSPNSLWKLITNNNNILRYQPWLIYAKCHYKSCYYAYLLLLSYNYVGCKDSSCCCHLKAYWFKCSSPSEPCPAQTMTTRVSFNISYLVPHFSEVWKCGKVWQGQVKVALFALVILYLHVLVVPHFSEVWTYGIVWQSGYCHTLSLGNEPVIIPALLSSTLLRCLELWMNSLTN